MLFICKSMFLTSMVKPVIMAAHQLCWPPAFLCFAADVFLLLARYVPNVAKKSSLYENSVSILRTDRRPTDQRPHIWEISSDVVPETAVLVSRPLETVFWRSWSWSWY